MLGRKIIFISFLWLFDSDAVFNHLKHLCNICTQFCVLPDTALGSGVFLGCCFPHNSTQRQEGTALPCFSMETLISAFTQNIPYESSMVLLGRQDQVLSIPRNNWTPRQHPAPSAPLEEGQWEQRGLTPMPGSQSQVHPSTSAHSWQRPQQSHAGRRHQKNLIYY